MKKKVGRSGIVKLSKNELHDLRAIFAPFDQTKHFRYIKKEGCNVEINLSKGVVTVTHGKIVILRISGLKNHHLITLEQGQTLEIIGGTR